MRKKSLVIKLGSEVFTVNGKMDANVFALVASQTGQLCRDGIAVTIVTSFAIRLGSLWLSQHKLHADLLPSALAGIGQVQLMHAWQSAYLQEGIGAGQILISDSCLMHRVEWENARATIDNYHSKGHVAVVNANDPISWAESERYTAKTSDNDYLTAELVLHMGVTDVLFLTKVAGVFSEHPKFPGARRYAQIDFDRPPIAVEFGPEDSYGGMKPKIEHAIACCDRGRRRVAITGLTPDVILKFARGNAVPTMIGSRAVLCE